MKTNEKFEEEFRKQVAMLRDLGQLPMLKLVLEEFSKQTKSRPKAKWPPRKEIR